jgi:hypothetical protein
MPAKIKIKVQYPDGSFTIYESIREAAEGENISYASLRFLLATSSKIWYKKKLYISKLQ